MGVLGGLPHIPKPGICRDLREPFPAWPAVTAGLERSRESGTSASRFAPLMERHVGCVYSCRSPWPVAGSGINPGGAGTCCQVPPGGTRGWVWGAPGRGGELGGSRLGEGGGGWVLCTLPPSLRDPGSSGHGGKLKRRKGKRNPRNHFGLWSGVWDRFCRSPAAPRSGHCHSRAPELQRGRNWERMSLKPRSQRISRRDTRVTPEQGTERRWKPAPAPSGGSRRCQPPALPGRAAGTLGTAPSRSEPADAAAGGKAGSCGGGPGAGGGPGPGEAAGRAGPTLFSEPGRAELVNYHSS